MLCKVLWVQSKTNTEFFSTSTDGQVLWWDYRKLAEPLEQMWIDPTKKQEKASAEGGLCLDFEASMVSETIQCHAVSCSLFVTHPVTHLVSPHGDPISMRPRALRTMQNP